MRIPRGAKTSIQEVPSIRVFLPLTAIPPKPGIWRCTPHLSGAIPPDLSRNDGRGGGPPLAIAV